MDEAAIRTMVTELVAALPAAAAAAAPPTTKFGSVKLTLDTFGGEDKTLFTDWQFHLLANLDHLAGSAAEDFRTPPSIT